MSTLRHLRKLRKVQPAPEHLDARVAPATVGAAVVLAAELRIEAREIGRWELALATSKPGSRDHRFLAKQIARTESRMAHQEVRLAGIEARALARMHARTLIPAATVMPAAVVAGPQPLPGHPRPILVTAPVNFLSGTVSAGTSTTSPSSGPTGTGGTSSLPDNVAQTLDVIYDAYQANPSDFPENLPSTNGANLVVIEGTSVEIQVHDSDPSNFAAMVTNLQNAGMQITNSSAQYGTVVGLLPISQLPTVAALPDAPSVTPVFHLLTN
jgi:hypothetical protein